MLWGFEMRRAFELLDHFCAGLNRVCTVLAGFFLFGMFATVFLQVIARYGFASPPFWTEELARWLMVWGALLGSTVAFRGHEDPAIVTPPVEADGRQKLKALARFVAAWLFLVPILWFSYPFVMRQLPRVSEGLQISSVWMVSALPIAAAVICLHAFAGLGALVSGSLLEKQKAAQRHPGPSLLDPDEPERAL